MKIVIASDHAGFALKETLKKELVALGHEPLDLGTSSSESVDYPDFGFKAAEGVASGAAALGVIICGSGIGISIAANRNPKIRAALCHNEESARLARQHNDANMLALGARLTPEKEAKAILRAFLETPFEGGRHAGRVAKLGKSG